ncbi:MAG: LPS assembly protein LptD [Tepidisphaeraceae bacterium]
MQVGGRIGLIVAAVLLIALTLPAHALGQYQPPAQSLVIAGKDASTWTADGANIIQLEGPVTIDLDRTRLSARQAVVWLREVRDGQPGEESVTVALIGDAQIRQPQATRSGERLIVTARVNGPIRITADNRVARDLSGSAPYRLGLAMREDVERRRAASPASPLPSRGGRGTATAPAALPKPSAPITFRSGQIQNIMAFNGKMALVLSGGVALTRQEEDGTHLEMQADRAVLFTTIERLRDVTGDQQRRTVEESIAAAYLEGDVRVTVTPPDELHAEQKLQANRVYYDFTTDRAVLTDAVLCMVDPTRQVPVIMRAETMRQLSEGEYRAAGAELTTSTFAVPSFALRADRIYVRQDDTGDPQLGTRTDFSAKDVTFRSFGLPFFYLPVVGGSVTDRGFPLRALSFGSSQNFGTSVETRWGLLETLGQAPPRDFDASFTLDYFSERGPAGGIDARYGGGIISETTRQAWNFEGDLESYFVLDQGTDDLGAQRGQVQPPKDLRGRIAWQHQHFFPDDWQVQLRAGWTSDATFLEEWFENDFNNGLPLETSLYLKKQHDTEAITFLATLQPNNVVTTADLIQEQFEVERYPEVGYHRIGDSFAGDKLTFFSDNTLGIMSFHESDTSLGDQGFRFGRGVVPGRPSLGLVGVSGAAGPPDVPDEANTRGDFRQEIDYPFSVGQVRVVPYVIGRHIGYIEAVDGAAANRVLAGTGVRFNTQFWKVDNAAKSDLFDIHRIRHIIEPEVHLFASASNIDPNELFIYDTPVDNINDVQAVQFALRQRWQTKRGGPGRLRSVDFLAFNVEANFFANQPDDEDLAPVGFRGLFFDSLPEASVPRNSINADAEWRMSDNTILLADAQHNLDEQVLATGSVGLIAKRDTRVTYFVGLRYIDELDSSIGTVAFSYELTRKYSVGLRQSYNFDDEGDVYSSLSFQRKFDRFFMMFTIYDDRVEDEQGIGFALYPEGLGAGASSDALGKFFGARN